MKMDKHNSAVRDDFVSLCAPLALKVVYECGSRDARDGCELASRLGAAELHVFECNPAGVELCRTTLEGNRWPFRTRLNPVAVSDKSGSIEFFPVDPARSTTSHADGNIGASSIFKLNKDYPHEELNQTRIEVPTIRLDDYILENSAPHLLWLDVQGAEALVLSGAKVALSQVKVIHTEVAYRPVFSGQPLFPTIDRMLRRDFRLVRLYGPMAWWKKNALRLNRWVPLTHWLRIGPWFTDAVYVAKNTHPPQAG